MSGKTNIIKVVILGDEKELRKATGEAVKDLGNVGEKADGAGSKFGKFAKVAGGIVAGGIGVGVAAMGLAIHAGDELNESQDQLAQTLTNVGSSYDSQAAFIKKSQKEGEKYGYTNAQINDGLNALITATGNATDAHELQGVVLDLAAKKHISLAEASVAVAKANEGNLKPLKQLGIDLPITAGSAAKTAVAFKAMGTAQDKVRLIQAAIADGQLKGKAASDALSKANFGLLTATNNYNDASSKGEKIIGALADRIHGSAEVAADSLAGKTAALKAKFADFTAHVGQVLIPILLQLASWVTTTVIPALGEASSWITTKAIPAIIAFGKRVAEIYTRYVKPTVDNIVTMFKGLWKQITGIMKLISDVFHGKWGDIAGDIRQIVSGIVQQITGAFSAVFSSLGRLAATGAKSLWKWFEGLPAKFATFEVSLNLAGLRLGESILKGIVNGIEGAVSFIAGIGKTLYNSFAGFVNEHLIDPIKGFKINAGPIHVKPFSALPDIPTLHGGGIYNSGQGEGYAKLQDHEGVFTPEQMAALPSLFAAPQRGGNVILNLPAGSDPQATVRAQRTYARIQGSTAR